MGTVADALRRVLPRSYDAIVAASGASLKAGQYSTADVQALIDYKKARLWATVAGVTEESLYNPRLVEFLAKLSALDFIPVAIDYWGRQVIAESTTGSNENVTYPSTQDSLWKLFESIRKQLAEEWNDVSNEYGFRLFVAGVMPRVSYGDNGRGVLITNDPMKFPHNNQWIADMGSLVGDAIFPWEPGE